MNYVRLKSEAARSIEAPAAVATGTVGVYERRPFSITSLDAFDQLVEYGVAIEFQSQDESGT
jgi:hypothetical protein